MPIYAYQCSTCGHDFDRLQKMSDPDPEVCPSCGATGNVKRQLTAPSFRLAGSGWYETDFKKDGDKKKNLVEGSSGSEKSKGESSAPAVKTDAASTTKPAETKASPKTDAPKVEKKPDKPASA